MTNDRIGRLREELAKQQIDALVLNPGPTLQYVTGHHFDSHERLFLLVVLASGQSFAIIPRLEDGNWREAVPEVDNIYLWDDAEGPEEAVGRAFANLTTARKVAVEPLSFRFMEYTHLKRHLSQAEIVSGDDVVMAQRLYKDSTEVGKLGRAIEIAEDTLHSVITEVRVGARERELAAKLASGLLARGGGGISFGPIVLSGPKSALPHGTPDDREVQAGELLLIDFGTSFDGYHSDITRTFVVGAEPDEAIRRVYEAVRSANEAGVRACKPGVSASEVHHLCQADLHGPQWEGFLKHRTGHGLGLDIHEPPSVMAGNQMTLEPGMVFTVEPGLYQEGFGGVRIEDDVLITEDGVESLTTFDRELQILGN